MADIRKKPYRKRRSRNSRRKHNKKKNVSSIFRNFVANDPFGPKRFTKMHYVDTMTLASTASANTFGVVKEYRLTSCYDPDYAAGGRQPYAFDQMALLYERYKVHGVKIKITLNDPTADACIFGAMIKNPSGLSETINGKTQSQVCDKPMAFIKNINNSGSQSATIETYLPMYQIFGLTKAQYANDINNTTADTATGSPLTEARIELGCANAHATSALTLRVRLEIWFYTEFYQRVIQNDV